MRMGKGVPTYLAHSSVSVWLPPAPPLSCDMTWHTYMTHTYHTYLSPYLPTLKKSGRSPSRAELPNVSSSYHTHIHYTRTYIDRVYLATYSQSIIILCTYLHTRHTSRPPPPPPAPGLVAKKAGRSPVPTALASLPKVSSFTVCRYVQKGNNNDDDDEWVRRMDLMNLPSSIFSVCLSRPLMTSTRCMNLPLCSVLYVCIWYAWVMMDDGGSRRVSSSASSSPREEHSLSLCEEGRGRVSAYNMLMIR